MKKFNKILFPIDFSDVSSEIAPYVISLADRLNAEVHIIYVVRRLENCRSIFVSHVAVENFEMEIVLGAETKMDEFVEAFFNSMIRPKTKILIGDIVKRVSL